MSGRTSGNVSQLKLRHANTTTAAKPSPRPARRIHPCWLVLLVVLIVARRTSVYAD